MVAMNVWPTDASDGSVATEARWRKMARGWQPSGVAGGVSTEMLPSLAFPNLTIKAGAAWVDGHFCELLGDQVLTATANGLAVVRFDPAANTAELLYRDGVSVPAQSPTGTYEMPVAKIVGSALTDVRPIVTPDGSLVFTNTAGRDLWTSPPNGTFVQAPAGMLWNRVAGAWQAGLGSTFQAFNMGVGSQTGPGGFIVADLQLASYSYPVRTTVWVQATWGFSGGIPTGYHSLVRKFDGSGLGNISDQPFTGGGQYQVTPFADSWTVAAGLQPGFHIATFITNATNAYLNASGIYTVERIG